MAKVYLDPNAGGVSQTEFDAHTHGYVKIIQLGVDANKNYGSPVKVDLQDGSEVNASDGTDLESIGITSAIVQTGVPTG